jgi:hypothetical protein
MIDEKEKTLRDFVHEAIVPLIEDVLVKKLYQALEVVVSEIKPPRKEWVGLTDEETLKQWHRTSEIIPMCDHYKHFYRAIEAKLKEKNT